MILKSKLQDPVYAYLIGSDGLIDEVFPVVTLDMEDIANCVTDESRRAMKDYPALNISLDMDGMKNPLIVILNTPENRQEAIKHVHKPYVEKYQEDKQYLALTGNSRLTYAIDNGYTQISCILVQDMNWMHAVQLILERGKIVNKLH